MAESEVAKLRREIAEEYIAAKMGLHGVTSGIARHTVINAKLARIGECHEQLVQLVGPQEAIRIIYEVNGAVVGK